MGVTGYIRPREKLSQRGSGSLSDSELLQIIVGSGISGARVATIARKLLGLLRKQSSELEYHQLTALPGIGPAKASMLLSVFELEARYQGRAIKVRYDSAFRDQVMSEVAQAQAITTLYVLIDIGGMVVGYRRIDASQQDIRRQLMLDLADRRVAKLVIVTGFREMSEYPDRRSMRAAQLIHQYARLVGVRIHEEWYVSPGASRKVSWYGG